MITYAFHYSYDDGQRGQHKVMQHEDLSHVLAWKEHILTNEFKGWGTSLSWKLIKTEILDEGVGLERAP